MYSYLQITNMKKNYFYLQETGAEWFKTKNLNVLESNANLIKTWKLLLIDSHAQIQESLSNSPKKNGGKYQDLDVQKLRYISEHTAAVIATKGGSMKL